jgi:hypothetical protein
MVFLKKVLRSFAALVLGASTVVAAVPAVNANTGSNLTPAAEAAFADVGRCLASGKDKRLSVHYLIDNSGSLRWTDPAEERRGILTGSVSQLGGFAEQGIDVEVSVSLFSSAANMLIDWTPIASRSAADQIAQRFGESLNNSLANGTTHWESGLGLGYRELASRGDSCKMLIWFTDGGINPDNSYDAVTASLSNLCRPGIDYGSLGSASNFGLMQQFRLANIPIFGVLYNNVEAAAAYFDQNYPGRTSDYLAEERWGMSFMQALIEGRGVIPTESFSGIDAVGGTLDCATVNSQGIAPPEQTNGAFLNSEDPVALAYQFLKLTSQISGGTLGAIRDGKFKVPPGTAKFEVLIAGSDWQLNGPADSGISASSAMPSPKVAAVQSAGAVVLSVRTVNEPGTSGEWEIETFGVQSELVLYPGLTFDLDRDRASKILSDYPNTITGRVIRTVEFVGEPVDLDLFSNYSISIAYLQGDSWIKLDGVTVSSSSQGDFAIENFSPPPGQDLLEVQLTLSLGSEFNDVESRFSLKVQDQQTLTRADTDNLKLSNLIGPTGKAEGLLVLKGPNLADESEFCFADRPDRLDDNQTGIEKVDRLASFDFRFTNSATGQAGPCFMVQRDQEVTVFVSASNPVQAASEIVSVWTISAETTGAGAKYEAPMRISFESETETNSAVALSVFLALLTIGVLGPLGIMWLINLMTTRFLSVEGTTRAVYPIEIDLTGNQPKITDARPGKSGNIVVEPRDFTSVQETPAPKRFETGHGAAVARVPRWPLSATWYEWQAPRGSRIISTYLGSASKTKAIGAHLAADVSPNMASNWAIVVPESELAKTERDGIKGSLIVYSTMKSLPEYQTLVQKHVNETSLKSKFDAATEAVRKDREKADAAASKKKNKPDEVAVTGVTVTPPMPRGGPPVPGAASSRPSGPPVPGAGPSSTASGPPVPGTGPGSTPLGPGGTLQPRPGVGPGSSGPNGSSNPPWNPGQ